MPPAAISRSSTYFPKICGNIPNVEGSALPGALLGALLGLACAPLEPVVTEVSVRANQLEGCPPPSGTELTLSLTPLGPFRAVPAQQVSLHARDAQLQFPSETQGVEARAPYGQLGFIGYTERRASTGIDVLLWGGGACPLRDTTSVIMYPGVGGG